MCYSKRPIVACLRDSLLLRSNIAFQRNKLEEVRTREEAQEYAIPNDRSFAAFVSQQNAQGIRSVEIGIQHAVCGRIGEISADLGGRPIGRRHPFDRADIDYSCKPT